MSTNSAHRADLPALLIRHVVFPLWAWKNGNSRLRYLAELESSQYWSAEVLARQQWTLFKDMVVHAFETCPYYRQKYRAAGITPNDLRSPEDIDKLPTITKEEVQEHGKELLSSKFAAEGLIRDMTGGSTGSPMIFYYDKERDESRAGATFRHNSWAGWHIGDRAAILWGAPRDMKVSGRLGGRLRTRMLGRSLMLDASVLSEAAMAGFARALQDYRPTVVQAYSNTLGLFARYIQAERIVGIRPRGIVCSAEVLTDENRLLIETTFDCPVFNRYGSREFAVIASECEAHEGMHINAENLLVEAVSDGRTHIDRDGEIVITDLRNLAMPMIRYRIRDVGLLKAKPCSCSRGLPLMELSGGRVTDFLQTTTGTRVSGIVIATYVVTNIPGIRQVQFVQNEPNAVVINLVKGPQCSAETLSALTARTRAYLGDDMQVQVQFRDHIPLEKSGKYRFSISTLT